MYDSDSRPKVSSIFWLSVLSVICFSLMSWMSLELGVNKYLSFGIAGGVGSVSLGVAAYLGIWHVYSLVLDLQSRKKDIETTSARLREMEAAKHLSSEQLAIIPKLEYGAEIGLHADPKNRTERRYFLITPDGMIPYEWCQDFLIDCGVTFVKPIRDYSEGTINYDYARWFTAWLRFNGFAVGGDGSQAGKAAQWSTVMSKSEACLFFGVETSSDDLNLHKHFTPQGADE